METIYQCIESTGKKINEVSLGSLQVSVIDHLKVSVSVQQVMPFFVFLQLYPVYLYWGGGGGGGRGGVTGVSPPPA